jgi:hypothetical protein
MDKRVLPQPALPQTNVGRPLGKPPKVISSSPSMPVGAFRSDMRWFMTVGELGTWLPGVFMRDQGRMPQGVFGFCETHNNEKDGYGRRSSVFHKVDGPSMG